MADDKQEPLIRARRIGSAASWFWTRGDSSSKPHPFPALGTAGAIVAALVTSSIGARIISNGAILLVYGWHAFFHDHLRLADWPRGRNGGPILSNGMPLHWAGTLIIVLGTIPVWAGLMLGVEFAARGVRRLLGPQWLWVGTIARLIAGIALIGFSLSLYATREHYAFLHPVPLAAFIGGLLLVCKAVSAPHVWRP